MHIIRYASAVDFLARTQPVLERDEAANNLMLGIAGRLCTDVASYGNAQPYLAVVETDTGGNDDPATIAIMTPPHSLLLHCKAENVATPFTLLADDLADSRWSVPGVNGPSHLSKAFADIWAARNGVTYRTEMALRTFKLSTVTHPLYSPGCLRSATMAELDLVIDWAQAFTLEAIGEHEPFDRDRARQRFAEAIAQRTLFFWDHNGPVSIASCGRPTAHGIAINMVYTPSHLRGRGYASSCVAALSQRLLDEGWQFCTLFTDLANPTANSIYQRLGYRPVCDFTHYLFESATLL